VIFARTLLCAAMGCGAAWAADQTLPGPVASAIKRLANPGQQTPPAPYGPKLDAPHVFILPGPVPAARARLGSQCSIPLAEFKPSDKAKFFIREMPAGKRLGDGMPVLQGRVCGENDAQAEQNARSK